MSSLGHAYVCLIQEITCTVSMLLRQGSPSLTPWPALLLQGVLAIQINRYWHLVSSMFRLH